MGENDIHKVMKLDHGSNACGMSSVNAATFLLQWHVPVVTWRGRGWGEGNELLSVQSFSRGGHRGLSPTLPEAALPLTYFMSDPLRHRGR